MTTLTFISDGSRIVGFDAAGHSGYAQSGQDIVCASVSSAVNLAAVTLNEVMGLAAAVHVDEKKAKVSLRLPGGLSPTAESTVQALLTGLMVYFSELQEQYPDNLEVLEA